MKRRSARAKAAAAAACCGDTDSEAVKRWLLLVEMPVMGLSWPLSSPRGPSVSVCHSFSTPARQPLSSTGHPGTTPSAHTQSRWALGTCCWREALILKERLRGGPEPEPEPPAGAARTCSRSLRSRSHFLMPLSREPLKNMSPWTTRDSMPS